MSITARVLTERYNTKWLKTESNCNLTWNFLHHRISCQPELKSLFSTLIVDWRTPLNLKPFCTCFCLRIRILYRFLIVINCEGLCKKMTVTLTMRPRTSRNVANLMRVDFEVWKVSIKYSYDVSSQSTFLWIASLAVFDVVWRGPERLTYFTLVIARFYSAEVSKYLFRVCLVRIPLNYVTQKGITWLSCTLS